MLTGPVFALQFLTISPPLVRRVPTAAELGAADAFFPLVGLLLGAFLVVTDRLLGMLFAPMVRDALLVIALAAITGALHLDGLIDSFDGLFVGRDREARLAAMRDPRAGSFGVVAVASVLLLKVAALGALPEHVRGPGLLLAPCLARWGIVQATWLFPYARPEGLGRAFKDGLRGPHVLIAAACAVGAAGLLVGTLGVALFAVSTLGVWAVGVAMSRRLGGLTGDTYGCLCELMEASVWLAIGIPMLGAGV